MLIGLDVLLTSEGKICTTVILSASIEIESVGFSAAGVSKSDIDSIEYPCHGRHTLLLTCYTSVAMKPNNNNKTSLVY